MCCLNTVPSNFFFFPRRTFHTIGILSLGKKGGDSHDHSGRLTFAPLCPWYQPTLIFSWRARRFETCRLHFLFLLRTENLTQKRQLVTFSAQFSRFKKCGQVGQSSSKHTNSSKHRGRSKPNREPGSQSSPVSLMFGSRYKKLSGAHGVQRDETNPCPNHLSFFLLPQAVKVFDYETKHWASFLMFLSSWVVVNSWR